MTSRSADWKKIPLQLRRGGVRLEYPYFGTCKGNSDNKPATEVNFNNGQGQFDLQHKKPKNKAN
jgi:hypothetical protein